MVTKELLLKLGFKHETSSTPFPSWYNIFDSEDDPFCSEVYTYTVWQFDGTEGPFCFTVLFSPRGPFGVFESNDEFGAPSRYARITCELDVVQCIEDITEFAKDLESKLNRNI